MSFQDPNKFGPTEKQAALALVLFVLSMCAIVARSWFSGVVAEGIKRFGL